MRYFFLSFFLSLLFFFFFYIFGLKTELTLYLVLCRICSCIENEDNLKFCMFYNKVFVENLPLETSWEFIFATMCRSTKYFPQIWSKLVTLKFPSDKIPLSMSEFTFEILETNLKTLFSRVILAN